MQTTVEGVLIVSTALDSCLLDSPIHLRGNAGYLDGVIIELDVGRGGIRTLLLGELNDVLPRFSV